MRFLERTATTTAVAFHSKCSYGSRFVIAVGVLIVLSTPEDSFAQTVLQHYGNNDPATEAWTLNTPGAVGDANDPIVAAWRTADYHTNSNPTSYSAPLSSEDVTAALERGWILRAYLRVVDASDNPGGSVKLDFSDGTKTWRLSFGSEVDGDPIVIAGDTPGPCPPHCPTFVVDGGGAGFHLYELKYDPATGTADLFVDRNPVPAIAGYDGFSDVVGPHVNWGSGSTSDMGRGDWNLIELQILCKCGQEQ